MRCENVLNERKSGGHCETNIVNVWCVFEQMVKEVMQWYEFMISLMRKIAQLPFFIFVTILT